MGQNKHAVVAEHIRTMYLSEFGGKRMGKFLMPHSHFRKIAKKKVLKETYVESFKDFLMEKHDLLMADVGDDYIILAVDSLLKARRIPKYEAATDSYIHTVFQMPLADLRKEALKYSIPSSSILHRGALFNLIKLFWFIDTKEVGDKDIDKQNALTAREVERALCRAKITVSKPFDIQEALNAIAEYQFNESDETPHAVNVKVIEPYIATTKREYKNFLEEIRYELDFEIVSHLYRNLAFDTSYIITRKSTAKLFNVSAIHVSKIYKRLEALGFMIAAGSRHILNKNFTNQEPFEPKPIAPRESYRFELQAMLQPDVEDIAITYDIKTLGMNKDEIIQAILDAKFN